MPKADAEVGLDAMEVTIRLVPHGYELAAEYQCAEHPERSFSMGRVRDYGGEIKDMTAALEEIIRLVHRLDHIVPADTPYAQSERDMFNRLAGI